MPERRRQFLRRGSVSLAFLSGCSSGDGSTSTDHPTVTKPPADRRTASSSPASTLTETQTPSAFEGIDLPGTVGVSHVDGAYDFTDEDYLNEGADQLAELGTNVVKTYLHRANEKYSFDSDWPDGFSSMRETVEHPHYREFLNGGFDTHVLTAYSHVEGGYGAYFTDGVSDEQAAAEYEEFRDLTDHLLREYRGTDKTFVLQHWEGDWHLLQGYDTTVEPEQTTVEGMIRWLTARQDGVEAGREAVDSDVTVLHATEVNRVRSAMVADRQRLVTEVLPEVPVDLVSYSAWDLAAALARFEDRTLVQETLSFINERTTAPTEYAREAIGDRSPVYLGEYGWPIVQHGAWEAERVIQWLTEEALDWGVPYAIYWQLYCNEQTGDEGNRPDNDDVAGFYLLKPDGSEAVSWEYLASLFA